MKKFLCINTLLIFISICNISYGMDSKYIWTKPLELTAMETSATIDSINYIDDESNPLNLDCGSCILIEQNTRKSFILI